MQTLSATGPREAVQAAWDALAWADPSPALSVDQKELARGRHQLTALCAGEAEADAARALAESAAPELSLVVKPLPERDWVRVSLEGLPQIAAGRFLVGGAHALDRTAPGRLALEVEAGPAFGTGHHGTTRGCLLALDRVLRRRRFARALDLGTGSGVLALAARAAGVPLVTATDIDRDSVETARENAARAGLGHGLHAVTAPGTAHALVQDAAPYPLVMANILMGPLVALSGEVTRVSAPGAALILSGLLPHQSAMAESAYLARGWRRRRRELVDGWAVLEMELGGAA